MKKLLLFFIITLLPVLGNAQTLIDGIYYNLNSSDNTASVTNNSNGYYSGNVVIPKQVFYGGTAYSVTSIDDNAFNSCTNLNSVSISNSVTSIGKGAFSKTSLRTLIVGAGLLQFNGQAFSGANQPIKTIWLTNTPPQNYSVAQGIVNYVANSQYGSLNNRIEYKYLSSMFNVDGITYVPVSPSERTCDAIDCIYDESISFVNIDETVSYQGIKMKVLSVRPYTFYQNNSLQKIDLDIQGSIGKHAFDGCTNLQTVELGNDILIIDEYAFNECSKLESIIVPDAVKEISQYAFYGCSNMASVIVGDGTETIGAHAFENCSNLTSATIGNSIKFIQQYAFSGCTLLPAITIPGSVRLIDDYTFQGCKNLKEIVVKVNDNESKTTLFDYITVQLGVSKTITIDVAKGEELSFNSQWWQGSITVSFLGKDIPYSGGTFKQIFNKDGKVSITLKSSNKPRENSYCTITNMKLIESGSLLLGSNGNSPIFVDCPLDSVFIDRDLAYRSESTSGYSPFYNNKFLRSIEITNNGEEISDNEFFGCSNLQNVQIGNGVTTIGDKAFSGCSGLKSFSFGTNVSNIGKEAFSDCTALTDLISRAANPPTCGSQALDDINKWTCKLTVPKGCLNSYQAADQWKDFFFIEEGDPLPVAVIGLLLNKTTSSFYIGESDTLTVSYTPENTTDRDIVWSSSDESIATVDNNGVVTGKKGGVANIIVRSVSKPEITASCEVIVRWPSIALNKTLTALPLGEKDSLTVIFTPENIINQKVEWSSSDEAIAVVDYNGVVTGKTKGSVTITAKYVLNPEITASCEVTIQGPNIIFADALVKAICVKRWDTNGDGELNESEAEIVKNLGTAFKYSNIQTFEELKYFTGLSNLSDDAFRECSHLTKIALPDNLKEIGNYAFSNCSALTSITIPPNVNSLGNHSFSFCDGIESFTIPNSVTYIGDYAFAYCSTLSAVKLPDNLTSINNYLFHYCTSLKDIKIPSSVTSIGYQSFLNCESLTTITIPQNVTNIGGNAFTDCEKLKTVVSLNETPPYLGNYVFPYGYVDGDHQGTYLLVPLGCKEKYQSYNQNNTPYFARIFEFEPEKGEYLVLKSYGGGKVIYDGLEVSNDKNAFTVAAGKRITLEIVADDGYELSSCIIDGDSIKELTRESDNTFSCTLIADKGHRIDAYFTEKIIEGSYLSVDNFYYKVLSNNELELHLRYNYHDGIPIYYSGDIVIPDSVVLPASFSQPQRVYKVTSIDKNAFYVYNGVENKLKSVVIGNNVTKIEDGTFRNCSNLVSVTLGTKINSIGDRAFYNCPKLSSVTIGSNVKTIGPWAFRSCYCLTSIDIPSSVITIGDEAFSGCPLTSIAIPNSITSIGADAFKNTPWYDNQPDGMVYAGKVAYKYKGEMPSNTSIELIEGTLGIAGGAFYNCSGLTSIIIPSSVTNIGSGTFIFCSNLSSILSFNPTPPFMTTASFNDSTATVYVPIGSKEAYRWADGWRYFKKIVDVLSDVDMSGQQSVMINEENFPDENFRAYLLSQSYGKDSVITKVEKMITTSLTISGRNIFDLKGIEHFPALTKLTVRSLPLSKLDLSKNTALTSLECYYTDLTNLDLSKNTALTSLKCSINQLTSLDVSKNTALTSLNCSSNQLTSLDVSKNTALTSLNCSSNQLTSLDVSKNTALKEMNCYRNRLTNLDVSKENVALTNLECSSNQIRGEAMDALVNNLPIQEQAKLFIISLTYSEGNLCTTAQVHAAKERGWQVFASSGEEYEGSDPSGIAIIEENFPDRNFRSFLLGQPYGKDGAITNEEIESITSMSLTTSGGSYSISDLKGIEYFSALTNLKLRGCSNLTSIDLSKNTALDSLEIVNCRLTSLDLTKNTALTYLDCTSNQFTSLDLSNNTALTILNCASNQLTSLDVSKNVALTSLDCSNNQLTSLDLPNSSELISINCTTNRLTSLDVSGNVALTSLDCASNQLTSLDVSKNTALTRLDCYTNQLTSLDVSNNLALTRLVCSNNRLTRLDVSKNTVLINLACTYNQLTSLDVSSNATLTTLACRDNLLTNLDVSKNPNLTGLGCQNNQLTSLEFSKNSALTELYCDFNQLSSLDLSESPALEVLYCNGNQLTNLDVSKNPALTELRCSSNQITGLGLSENTALRLLYCNGNQLTTLDVSENTALRELYCSMNQIKDEAMNTLVNSLPKQERASLYVLSLTDSTEGNVCTKANVNTAKEKGWNVLAFSNWNWIDYEGGDPSEIHAITLDKDTKVPIYDLNGRKLQMPRRGINIIGGKKVVVK